MGLFDKILGTDDELTPAEGVIGIVVAAAAADGVITRDEVDTLGTSLSRMRLFRDVSERKIGKAFERVAKIANDDGPKGLVKRAADAVPDDLRATTFAIATDLLFADGDVSSRERAFLEETRSILGVDEETAVKVVEVMELKNRG